MILNCKVLPFGMILGSKEDFTFTVRQLFDLHVSKNIVVAGMMRLKEGTFS